MKQKNNSLIVIILRGVVGLFSVIAFFLMFLAQVQQFKNVYFDIGEVTGGVMGFNGSAFPLIGYILMLIGGLCSIAMIFVSKMIKEQKVRKIVNIAISCGLVLAGVLVVLTANWLAWAQSSKISTNFTLCAAPITACVFAVCSGLVNVANIVLDK